MSRFSDRRRRAAGAGRETPAAATPAPRQRSRLTPLVDLAEGDLDRIRADNAIRPAAAEPAGHGAPPRTAPVARRSSAAPASAPAKAAASVPYRITVFVNDPAAGARIDAICAAHGVASEELVAGIFRRRRHDLFAAAEASGWEEIVRGPSSRPFRINLRLPVAFLEAASAARDPLGLKGRPVTAARVLSAALEALLRAEPNPL